MDTPAPQSPPPPHPTAALDAFLAVVRTRRSCRAYDPARPVPPAAIAACLEAARLAPSACNRQPWRFVVVQDAATRAAIYEEARLPGIAHRWLQDVPAIVVLCVERELVTHKLAPAVSGVPYHLVDAGIAGEHFVLAATAQGLGTCWIGWFRPPVVRRLLDLPGGVDAVALLALGYPAAGDAKAPRPRRPLGEIACADRWGQPFAVRD